MRSAITRIRANLPHGRPLEPGTFERRHRLLLGLLTLHLPALAVVGLVRGAPPSHLALELSPLLVAVVVGRFAPGRTVRSLTVTLALVGAASVLVHLTGGLVEAHFHFFVMLGFVALYQDWRTFLLAVGYSTVGHGLLGAVSPVLVSDHAAGGAAEWRWLGFHALFVVFAAVAHLIFWKLHEQQQEESRHYYSALYEAERGLVSQLRRAQTLKDELLSVVGHEFRTPLTAIQGYARTLDARLDEMEPERARQSATAIEREAKRLTRLVANLLSASDERPPEPGACTTVRDLVGDVVVDVVELSAPRHDIRVHVDEEHTVAMAADTLHQVLFNLLDNAVKFADAETAVRLTTRRDAGGVVLEVTNVGPPISVTGRERIFDAFVQADSSDTRRYGGIGLGLHIVRKLVTAHGGRIGVICEGPVVIFRVWLPSATPSGSPSSAPDPADLPVEA